MGISELSGVVIQIPVGDTSVLIFRGGADIQVGSVLRHMWKSSQAGKSAFDYCQEYWKNG